MAGEYVQLEARFNPLLVCLAWAVSFLGAVSTSQVLAQSQFSVRYTSRLRWIFLASLTFGLCSIWSLHFVAIISQKFPVNISMNPALTILSAAVSVFFTYIALAGDTLYKYYRRKRSSHLRRQRKSVKRQKQDTANIARSKAGQEEEAQEPLLPNSNNGSDEEGDREVDTDDWIEDDQPMARDLEEQAQSQHDSSVHVRDFADGLPPQPASRSTSNSSASQNANKSRPTLQVIGHSSQSNYSAYSAKSDNTAARRNSNNSTATRTDSGSFSALSTEESSTADGEDDSNANSRTLGGLGLSKAAKTAIRRKRNTRSFFAVLLSNMMANAVNPFILARSAVWATAICLMHYCGMLAMHIEDGFIRWNGWLILASFVVAFLVCMIAVSFLQDLETRMTRQMLFAFFAASGVASMHYTGAAAATYYSAAEQQPSYSNAYSVPLLAATIGCSILTCMVSNLIVSNTASLSRDKLIEVVMTKRRLWRVMAQKDAAEQAAMLKSDFISIASHEIRTPLHTVSGYSELLNRTTLTDEQHLYLVNIQRAINTIQLITKQVLDYSRMERGHGDNDTRPVDVNLRSMLDSLSEMTEDQPRDFNYVALMIYVSPRIPELAYLDETYLTRVLMNLVSNALKFTQQGYVLIDLDLAEDATQLCFRISDTGIGIPKKFHPALFDAFTQADQSLTRPHSGTGLGLAIAKQLTNRLDGSIEVDSTEGKGTTFIVKIPLGHQVQIEEPQVKDDAIIQDGQLILPLQPSNSASSAQPVASDAPEKVKQSATSDLELPSSKQMAQLQHHGRSDSRGKDIKPKSEVVITVCSEDARLREKMASLWRRYEFDVSEWNEETAKSKELADADFIFLDFPWIAQNLVLLDSILLTNANVKTDTKSTPRPIICLPYNDAEQFSISPQLMVASNVIRLKQPLFFHKTLQLMQNPMPYLTATPETKSRLKLVRFASTEPADEDSVQDTVMKQAVRVAALDAADFQIQVNNGNALQEGAPDDNPIRPPSPPRPAAAVETTSALVLLVEDNPVNQRLGARILAKLGYNVRLASNGREAVDMVDLIKPALVLMDCHMPIMDGFDATRCIRSMEAGGRLDGKIPIVALTANVSAESELECIRAGMQHFLSKPLLINELQTVLSQYITAS